MQINEINENIKLYKITSNKNGIFCENHSESVEKIIEYFFDTKTNVEMINHYNGAINSLNDFDTKTLSKLMINFYTKILKSKKESLIKGNIGEFLMNSIARKIYNFKMTVPRFHFITNENQSVYGSDGVYLSNDEDKLIIAESKMVRTLSSGINEINKDILKNDLIHINRTISPIHSMRINIKDSSVVKLSKLSEDLNVDFEILTKEYKLIFLGSVLYEKDDLNLPEEIEKIENIVLENNQLFEEINLILIPHKSFQTFLKILNLKLERWRNEFGN